VAVCRLFALAFFEQTLGWDVGMLTPRLFFLEEDMIGTILITNIWEDGVSQIMRAWFPGHSLRGKRTPNSATSDVI